MFQYSIENIASITQSSTILWNPSTIVLNLHLDSRTYHGDKNTVFLAIVGKNHNGHAFINEMYEKGCRVFWVQSGHTYPVFNDADYIISNNVLRAFQTLMTDYRKRYKNELIAVTGSNGKTIIKEWLYAILSVDFKVVRSPKSFNSQIGVPLSLKLLDNRFEIACIEAGISEVGEMNHLEKMIQPTIGVFTNIGDAHQENFSSIDEKVRQKMHLFKNVHSIVYCADMHEIHMCAQLLPAKKYAWSFNKNGNIEVSVSVENNLSKITIQGSGINIETNVPFLDSASIENAIHCIITAHVLHASKNAIQHIMNVPKVEMRLELLQAKNNCTLINDSYNSDLQSVYLALQVLEQQSQQESKTVVLSDIMQSGISKTDLYTQINQLIATHNINRFIAVGPDLKKYLNHSDLPVSFYASTEALLQDTTLRFENEVILLKGARSFEFEKIAQKFVLLTHQTYIEINLQSIVDNLNYFKSYLLPKTKVMAMVKAFSYGSGSYEIANVLQHHKVDYLAVAFVDEGIELRNAGIELPIAVMNPEIGVMEQLFEYNLEPEIHSFSVFEEFKKLCVNYPEKEFTYHIKIDTGMARYGFLPNEINRLVKEMKLLTNAKVVSIFSHLVGTDDAQFDDFTLQQIKTFEEAYNTIVSAFEHTIIKHILNSAGIERFSKFQFDMVRLGIGLYGVSAIAENKTKHISTLKTFVSSIRNVSKEQTVGYSRKGKVTRDSKIAVLPIGYADGLSRGLSNGVGSVLIKNKEVPFVGNICMDACMIDVTGIEVNVGDEVIIFGEKLPISVMASKLNTIPYEIITSISKRVKRVYVYE